MRAAMLLVFLLGACTASSMPAQDLSGVYRGRWTANASERRPEHGGAMRVRLRSQGTHGTPQSYRGVFMGRFAVVIPYFYRADVTQVGNQLHASKKLGPMGTYQMRLHSSTHGINGSWSAAGSSGRIHLQRVR